jgi:hypothetical protein
LARSPERSGSPATGPLTCVRYSSPATCAEATSAGRGPGARTAQGPDALAGRVRDRQRLSVMTEAPTRPRPLKRHLRCRLARGFDRSGFGRAGEPPSGRGPARLERGSLWLPATWTDAGFPSPPPFARRLSALCEGYVCQAERAAEADTVAALQVGERDRLLTWGRDGIHPWSHFLAHDGARGRDRPPRGPPPAVGLSRSGRRCFNAGPRPLPRSRTGCTWIWYPPTEREMKR